MAETNLMVVKNLFDFYAGEHNLEKKLDLLDGQIKRSSNAIEKSSFTIAACLYCVKQAFLYFHQITRDGVTYNDVYTYAEEKYGFGKTSTKNAIGIVDTYFNDGVLKYQFEGYSYSQLVELLPMARGDGLTADYRGYKVAEIRQLKKQLSGQTSDQIEEDDGDTCGLDYIANARPLSDAADTEEPQEEPRSQTSDRITVYTEQEVIDLGLLGANRWFKFNLYRKYFEKDVISNEFFNFVKETYGWFCSGCLDYGYDSRPSQGISFYRRFGDEIIEVSLTWRKAAARIKQLIEEERYLDARELEEYEEWYGKQRGQTSDQIEEEDIEEAIVEDIEEESGVPSEPDSIEPAQEVGQTVIRSGIDNCIYHCVNAEEYDGNFDRLAPQLDWQRKFDLVELICFLLPPGTGTAKLHDLQSKLRYVRKVSNAKLDDAEDEGGAA